MYWGKGSKETSALTRHSLKYIHQAKNDMRRQDEGSALLDQKSKNLCREMRIHIRKTHFRSPPKRHAEASSGLSFLLLLLFLVADSQSSARRARPRALPHDQTVGELALLS